VLAVLFAPPLAAKFGWSSVYGLASLTMVVPMLVMWFVAKEPPDREHQTLREHVSCLFEKDGWVFSLIYIVTFGGFIGLASFLPTYFYDQFHVTKVQAGQLTMLATIMGSALRIVGGYISDRIGGIRTLSTVLLIVAASLVFCGLAGTSLTVTTLLFMLCFAALGAGNGALFQLVPLRWPLTTAVAGSMIGEIGALGGGFIPNAMGQSKQHLDTYLWGFVAFAVLAVVMLVMLRFVQIRWTRTWAEKGGRARANDLKSAAAGVDNERRGAALRSADSLLASAARTAASRST
jgi:MFS transporter, NNP family, nitrate/nitrite transporter